MFTTGYTRVALPTQYAYTSAGTTPVPYAPAVDFSATSDWGTVEDIVLAGPPETIVPLVAQLRSEGWTATQLGPNSFELEPPK